MRSVDDPVDDERQLRFRNDNLNCRGRPACFDNLADLLIIAVIGVVTLQNAEIKMPEEKLRDMLKEFAAKK